jgi:hypothetical protein
LFRVLLGKKSESWQTAAQLASPAAMSKHGVKSISAAIAFVIVADVAAVQRVPLPRPRPRIDREAIPADSEASTPSACRVRLTVERAIAPSVASIDGPDECGSGDLVRLEAVILPNRGSRVDITPPATLRCVMAEAIADWVREDLTPLAELSFGSMPRAVQSYAGYNCRPRNNIPGAMTSEHGKGNALDVGAIKLSNGKAIDLADPDLDPDVRESLKGSACRRFSTVLGPGSDAYHENHVHLDLRERRNGYRICQWEILTTVPLPPPRPRMDLSTGTGK